jgi:hypothetical protein
MAFFCSDFADAPFVFAAVSSESTQNPTKSDSTLPGDSDSLRMISRPAVFDVGEAAMAHKRQFDHHSNAAGCGARPDGLRCHTVFRDGEDQLILHCAYELRAEVLGADRVWRTLLVPADISLHALHDVLQIAMGWHDRRPHMFLMPNGDQYGDMRLAALLRGARIDSVDPARLYEESGCWLSELLIQPDDRMIYEYDPVDSSDVGITLIALLPTPIEEQCPACLDGEGVCDRPGECNPNADRPGRRAGHCAVPQKVDLSAINDRLRCFFNRPAGAAGGLTLELR